jgi:hypothetical protein
MMINKTITVTKRPFLIQGGIGPEHPKNAVTCMYKYMLHELGEKTERRYHNMQVREDALHSIKEKGR